MFELIDIKTGKSVKKYYLFNHLKLVARAKQLVNWEIKDSKGQCVAWFKVYNPNAAHHG